MKKLNSINYGVIQKIENYEKDFHKTILFLNSNPAVLGTADK